MTARRFLADVFLLAFVVACIVTEVLAAGLVMQP